MNTISKSWPSWVRSSHLRVPSVETCASTTSGRRDHEALGEPRPLRLGDVGHRREFGDAAIVDPVPDLLGAQLGLLGLQPRRLERGADCVLAAGPTSSTLPSARGFTPAERARDRRAPGIGIRVVSALMASALSRYDQRDFASAAQRAARRRRIDRRGSAVEHIRIDEPDAPRVASFDPHAPAGARGVDDRLAPAPAHGSRPSRRARPAGTAGRRCAGLTLDPGRATRLSCAWNSPQRRWSARERKAGRRLYLAPWRDPFPTATALRTRRRGRSPPTRRPRQ